MISLACSLWPSESASCFLKVCVFISSFKWRLVAHLVTLDAFLTSYGVNVNLVADGMIIGNTLITEMKVNMFANLTPQTWCRTPQHFNIFFFHL